MSSYKTRISILHTNCDQSHKEAVKRLSRSALGSSILLELETLAHALAPHAPEAAFPAAGRMILDQLPALLERRVDFALVLGNLSPTALRIIEEYTPGDTKVVLVSFFSQPPNLISAHYEASIKLRRLMPSVQPHVIYMLHNGQRTAVMAEALPGEELVTKAEFRSKTRAEAS